jgi:hypothetical protein
LSAVLVAMAVLVAGCRSKQDGIPPDTTRPDPVDATGTGGRGGSTGTGGGGRGGSTGGSGGSAGDAGSAEVSVDGALDTPSDRALDGPNSDGPIDSSPDVVIAPDLAPDRTPDAPRNLAQGAACNAPAECRSGFCAGGFCCNMACTEPCLACAMVATGMANGTCGPNRMKVGQKCGQGCQQVLTNIPAVVDKTCDAMGRCVVPMIPQNFELCADEDACTTLNCDQDTRAHTARCVKIGCAAGMCCCDGGSAARMCVRTQSCTGQGKACATP